MEKIKNNAFIISEYNPFHNGHKYHIDKTREAGAENIICIMNGNFVQRGEPAYFSKSFRAKCAVENGADLVIELPMKYGISTANYFAYGGILSAVLTGLEGTVSFGASADTAQLRALSDIIRSPETNAGIQKLTKNSGKTYPAALQTFIHDEYPVYEHLTADANNLLAIEYINTINKYGRMLDWQCIERSAEFGHDSEKASDIFMSAKYIRTLFDNNKTDAAKSYIPSDTYENILKELNAGRCFQNKRLFSNAALSILMNMSEEDLRSVNGVSQGLENRITEYVKSSSTLETLYDNVKTKRFTHARIRQIVLAAVLGVTRNDLDNGISYLRVLAFNDKGRALLKTMRNTASVPVITNISDISASFSTSAQRDKQLDIKAGKLYELCKSSPADIDPEFHVKPYYLSAEK